MSPVEWHRRTDFAEVAEVVGVRTDEVIAVMLPQADGMVRVLYTTGTDDQATATVHMALVGRSAADDTLFVDSTHYVGTLRNWFAKMGLPLN